MPGLPVFISWSGNRSRAVGETLHTWLPTVIQAVEPWMSSHDIEKGTRGEVGIAEKLEEVKFGIICLTPTNMHADWILFEAGALSKMREAHVCTYLWNLQPSNVEKPLGAFQHTVATEQDTKQLIETINGRLGEPVKQAVLDPVFERMWPDLRDKLKQVEQIDGDADAEELRSPESMFSEIIDTLRKVEKQVGVSSSLPFPLERVSLLDAEGRLLQALLNAPNGRLLGIYKGERFAAARKSIVEKKYVDMVDRRFVLNENGLRVLGGLLLQAWERFP